MINDKTRTKVSDRNGMTYTDSTYRTWLRNVGEGGDRSSLVRTVSTGIGEDDKWISADLILSDCSGQVHYDMYIDSNKAAKRQLEFLGKLREEVLILELELYHTAKRFGWTQTEDEQDESTV
jgi:hypothetical protein